MSRVLNSLGVATALAAAIALPTTAAATPNGQGLFPHEADTCTDSSGGPMSDTAMLLSGGTSFWMGGVHYAVKSVTYTGAVTGTFDYGVKNGLTGAGEINCYGHFDDPVLGTYYVHSTDVPIN